MRADEPELQAEQTIRKIAKSVPEDFPLQSETNFRAILRKDRLC
jgi:hypothetical protein